MKNNNTITNLGLFVVLFAGLTGLFIQVAEAADLTSLSDTMSRLTVSTTATSTIKFTTPTGANAPTNNIVITFPSDFNFTSKTPSTITFSHGAVTGYEATETLDYLPSAANWGVATSSTQNRVWTFTAPTDGVGAATLASSTKAIFTFNPVNATNPSVSGSYTIGINGTFGDTGSTTVQILDNDQVSVTATVNQTITFSISDNTIGFGTLNSSAARYATGDTTGTGSEAEAHTLIVGTNASSGYTMTVKGSTLQDSSGNFSIDAIGSSNTASSAGTEQFGLRMNASGGSGSVSAPYSASGFAFAATATTSSQVASSAGSSANTTYSVRYLANITSQTEALSYSTALTYLATANF